MTTAALAGGAIGLTLLVGVVLLVAGLPALNQIDLSQRIEPYLDRAPAPSRLLAAPAPTSGGWRTGALDRLLKRLGTRLGRLLGGATSVRERMQRAGLPDDVEGFRIQQVLWGCTAALLGAGVASLLWWTRGAPLGALLVVVGCSALGGVLLRDQLLTRSAVRREERMLAEFPAVAELLALSVTAGEGTTQALERVARLSTGDLSIELETALAQARTGLPMHQALSDLGSRTGVPAITRFVDGLVVAIERGTPLGEVLRAQAQDAREAARQALIEQGGKKEIAMMVPVVFLVLPVTVLFAVYPGLTLLRIAL